MVTLFQGKLSRLSAVVLGLLCLASLTPHEISAVEPATTQQLLATIKAVGPEGKGNTEAAEAWKSLIQRGKSAIVPTLAAMDATNPIADNWLRTAVQAIFEQALQANQPLPTPEIEKFLTDTKQAPAARRLAYELMARLDSIARERFLPKMIEDPSVDLRRDAIAYALEEVTPLIKSDAPAAQKRLETLFRASRDKDQAEAIVKSLKELKAEPDLTSHFGVITQWRVIGPFDGPEGKRFSQAHPPESKVELMGTFKGKDDAKLEWVPFVSTDTYGVVDLNKLLGKHKNAVAYAYTEIEAKSETPTEIRFGTMCGVKVFLNGKEVFGRDEYHHGQRFDQYVCKGVLKAGTNSLLLKICQNNQTESWAQDWKFQLRLCDATGGALPIRVVPVLK